MRKESKSAITTVLVLLGILSLCFVSCTSGSGNRVPSATANIAEKAAKDSIVRVLVMENQTISFVRIDKNIISAYNNGDVVWVNLATHRIDDVNETAMKAKLIMGNPNKFYNGEGNEIPTEVVKLFVQSQFVGIPQHEFELVKQYFPINN